MVQMKINGKISMKSMLLSLLSLSGKKSEDVHDFTFTEDVGPTIESTGQTALSESDIF